MVKRISFLFVLVLLISTSIYAQEYALSKHQISAAYFGEILTHKGIRIGYSIPLKQNPSRKTNISRKLINQKRKDKNEFKFINRGWVLGSYLTYYKHPRNHTGIMLTGVIGRQRIGNKGFISAINLEAGYMLSLLDGEVFATDRNKFVKGDKSSSHIVFGFNGGVGWNFEKQGKLPLSFMIQPHAYIQAPYNTFLIPRLALETKIIYHLK